MTNYKNDNAYKSIGEVAKLLNLMSHSGKPNTHTIRFWEKEFKQLQPFILSGRRRYYDKINIELLRKIKYLLKDQGMTIKGVKKLLDNNKLLKLDETKNKSINSNNNIRTKLKNISNIIKEIKKIK
tara:strand:- start:18 stop:395 length:378 start_codon:yes stop_codon:yes gene_type:complete